MILMNYFHGNAMSDFNGFQRMNVEILSFQVICNFLRFLKCDKKKAT